MELFSKQDPAVRQSLNAHINQRWGQLYELEKEWGERALRYLLLTNSGGAIATLGFLGGSPTAINMLGAKISLFLFVLGVFLVGVSTAKTFHHMSHLFKTWKADVDHYYSDKITWEYLQEEDTKRAVEDFWDYAIPYASFGCFIAGSVSGAISLFV
ncbi:MAG: hypothetical protein JZU45_14075 [Methyloversatilis discipulorum]|uniref:hypothetical protein n=1 Tax=Methyloversatilis discipulorum TaxID=1119528 RepID=UPI0026EA30E6|nr:hypothetical protein [Methyloversatilis discipulorum]MBV5287204.1 hypothetical protein [Methyloversatilis discipulorum]